MGGGARIPEKRSPPQLTTAVAAITVVVMPLNTTTLDDLSLDFGMFDLAPTTGHIVRAGARRFAVRRLTSHAFVAIR